MLNIKDNTLTWNGGSLYEASIYALASPMLRVNCPISSSLAQSPLPPFSTFPPMHLRINDHRQHEHAQIFFHWHTPPLMLAESTFSYSSYKCVLALEHLSQLFCPVLWVGDSARNCWWDHHGYFIDSPRMVVSSSSCLVPLAFCSWMLLHSAFCLSSRPHPPSSGWWGRWQVKTVFSRRLPWSMLHILDIS